MAKLDDLIKELQDKLQDLETQEQAGTREYDQAQDYAKAMEEAKKAHNYAKAMEEAKAQKHAKAMEEAKTQKYAKATKKTEEDESQTHVHEFLGSTKLAEEGEDRHNHRFAGVTSEVIPMGTSHVHALLTNTDFFDHHHEIGVLTGPAIEIGGGKHIHFVEDANTTFDDGHCHKVTFATLIQSPLLPPKECSLS